jgi:uncharacterized protein YkwD
VSFSRRRIIISALILSCLVGGSVGTAAPASATTRTESQMVGLINHSRQHYGRSKLSYSMSLSIFARKHSAAMAERRTIFHTTNLAYKLRSFSWRVAGENVGMGPSMISLHEAFMKSPHHRDNILYRGFHRVGVGVAWRSGIAYITVIFLG